MHNSVIYAWEHFYKNCTDFDNHSDAIILDCSTVKKFKEATVLLPCLKYSQPDTVKNLIKCLSYQQPTIMDPWHQWCLLFFPLFSFPATHSLHKHPLCLLLWKMLHIFIWIYVNVYIYMYICICILNVYLYIYINIYKCVCVCVCVCGI